MSYSLQAPQQEPSWSGFSSRTTSLSSPLRWACGHPLAGKRATRFTAAALAGYGAVSTAGLLLFPMDVRGTVESQRDTLHIVATIVMSIFIVAVMAFGAFAHGMRFRLYSFATIVTVVVFGAWAGFLARPMPGPTPWLGLAERVNIYATMLWMAVLAVSLLRVQGYTSTRPMVTNAAVSRRVCSPTAWVRFAWSTKATVPAEGVCNTHLSKDRTAGGTS